MSRATLEAELNVPSYATLSSFSSNSTTLYTFLQTPSSSTPPLFLSISNHTTDTNNTDTIHNCLILGRNEACDHRLAHKSISRKAFALFFSKEDPPSISAPAPLYGMNVTKKDGNCSLDEVPIKAGEVVRINPNSVLHFGKMDISFEVKVQQQIQEGHGLEEGLGVGVDEHEHEHEPQKEEEKEEEKQKETTREERIAQINAMTASLDSEEPLSYTKFNSNTAPPSSSSSSSHSNNNNHNPQQSLQSLDIPVSHTATLSSHEKSVTTLDLDPKGSRMVTGSKDQSIRLYDFNGMDSLCRHFKEVIVDPGHPVVSLSYSPTGSNFVVGTASAQPKVFDRNGGEVIQFVKGDVYVATDVSKTTGHIAAVTSVLWHPIDKEKVLSGSIDGSLRLWDIVGGKTNFKKLCCDKVGRVKTTNNQFQKVSCTSLAMSGPNLISIGTGGGALQLWDMRKLGSGGRAEVVVESAHAQNTDLTWLGFSPDGTKIATRGMDHVVKVWDKRKFGSNSPTPLKIYSNVETFTEGSSCAFSPDGKILCAPTAAPNNKGKGMIKFFDLGSSAGGTPMASIVGAEDSSAVCVKWHAALNQIVCGSSAGSTNIFYDPELSSKGAMLGMGRTARKPDALEELLQSRVANSETIFTPHALPMFQDAENSAKRKRKDMSDPIKSKRPQEGGGKGAILPGGQNSASSNFTQAVCEGLVKQKFLQTNGTSDPRDELFKYEEENVTGVKTGLERAYAVSDPNRVRMTKTSEMLEDEEKEKEQKRRA